MNMDRRRTASKKTALASVNPGRAHLGDRSLAGHRRKDAAPGGFCNSEVLRDDAAAARKKAPCEHGAFAFTACGAIRP
ncbi:hypothetical protein [Bradyrhizobium japonicum]|uniref:hypothetical protein n=1 Tax=Bradyrhizobium japonicum TaxID=375 RepID=UPI0012BC0654|nr:hypothetical protein [Bradyrhizobium japonicum]